MSLFIQYVCQFSAETREFINFKYNFNIGGNKMKTYNKYKKKIIKFLNIFRSVNITNSKMGVNCVQPNTCSSRFTTTCETCIYNLNTYIII